MGDAGPPTPPPGLEPNIAVPDLEHETSLREVTVLVTGFGPFKSFMINPSGLIAASLPSVLPSQPPGPTLHSDPSIPKAPPYQIRLLVHPAPVRVAYATAASLFPALYQHPSCSSSLPPSSSSTTAPSNPPDYVLHIGMAGGRTHYTLETTAHRDAYRIKDVDDRDGWSVGEHAWKSQNPVVPEKLLVGWDENDVLERWRRDVEALELNRERKTTGAAQIALGLAGEKEKEKQKEPLVALSTDAGRFLCEFALFTALAYRWREARLAESSLPPSDPRLEEAREREGKAAFLHVPGGFMPEDVERGVRVAEAAIRSLVGSWEAGRRRREGVEDKVGIEKGKWEGVVWKA